MSRRPKESTHLVLAVAVASRGTTGHFDGVVGVSGESGCRQVAGVVRVKFCVDLKSAEWRTLALISQQTSTVSGGR